MSLEAIVKGEKGPCAALKGSLGDRNNFFASQCDIRKTILLLKTFVFDEFGVSF